VLVTRSGRVVWNFHHDNKVGATLRRKKIVER